MNATSRLKVTLTFGDSRWKSAHTEGEDRLQLLPLPCVFHTRHKLSPNSTTTNPEQQQPKSTMHIAVLGPAGFGGSNVCVELIIRGHDIIGISRSPEKLGKHSRYTPLRLDLLSVSVAELMHIFEKFDVLVDAFIPPAGPGMYSTPCLKSLPTVQLAQST